MDVDRFLGAVATIVSPIILVFALLAVSGVIPQ